MLKVRPLPEDLQRIAIEELNEIPERVADDVEALREWIKKQSYLRSRIDDQFLLSFLRGCKFSLEKTKFKIDRYWTLRTQYPDFFTIRNVNCPKVLEIIRIGVGIALPIPLNENGPRLFYVRPGLYPPDKYTFSDIMGCANGLQAISIIEDDYSIVNGVISILDMSQITAAHLVQMTPSVMKKMSVFGEEAIPLRDKATHVINPSTTWERVYNVLKPFMPVKQQERLYVHGNNLESLYDHVPKKYLPEELGGENGSIPEIIAETEETFNLFRKYLKEDITYGTNEALRPNASSQNMDAFGVEGSFRQLNVD